MSEAAEPREHPLGAEATTSSPSVRVRVDLAYDGACFSGWAKQPGLVTVEGCLEEAFELVLREPVRLTVAGRTDAGVHAGHQVLHLDVPAPRWEGLAGRSGDGPGEALVRKVNGALSRVLGRVGHPLRPGARPVEIGAVALSRAREVPASFDARFSALSRTYLYRIADGPMRRTPLNRTYSWALKDAVDPGELSRAAEPLLGLHDFLSFCKPRPGATTVRELHQLSFARGEGGLIEATVRADAFCHNMVRALVGACVAVAEGRREPGWLAGRIQSPARDSSIRLAPPEGLMLRRIDYPETPEDWAGRAEATRARRGRPA